MKRSSWKSLIIFLAFGLAVIGGRLIGLSLIERIFVVIVLGALVELSFYLTRKKNNIETPQMRGFIFMKPLSFFKNFLN